jgi:hypothetical protein
VVIENTKTIGTLHNKDPISTLSSKLKMDNKEKTIKTMITHVIPSNEQHLACIELFGQNVKSCFLRHSAKPDAIVKTPSAHIRCIELAETILFILIINKQSNVKAAETIIKQPKAISVIESERDRARQIIANVQTNMLILTLML